MNGWREKPGSESTFWHGRGLLFSIHDDDGDSDNLDDHTKRIPLGLATLQAQWMLFRWRSNNNNNSWEKRSSSSHRKRNCLLEISSLLMLNLKSIITLWLRRARKLRWRERIRKRYTGNPAAVSLSLTTTYSHQTSLADKIRSLHQNLIVPYL